MDSHSADEKTEMQKEVGRLFSKARTETETDEHPTGSQTPSHPACSVSPRVLFAVILTSSSQGGGESVGQCTC